MGYNKFLGVTTGINYVDQTGEHTISILSPAFRVVRGANINDKPKTE